MSKVIKKIGKTLLHSLSSVVLLAILLILAVAMAMSLPRVQTFVAIKATEWLNKECGVNISIGAISLENITTLTAEEVYVEDLAGDTLLWVNKLSGKIDRRALLDEGRLVPYNAKIKGAKFYLAENRGDKKNNIDQLIEKIESHFPAKETTTQTSFAIENVEAEDFRFRLYDEELAGRVPAGSIDYSDMDILVSSATFGKIEVVGRDVILTNVENINAVDKTQAHLYDSSFGRLLVGWGLLDFQDIDFLSGGSHLVLPSLVLSAPDWDDYQDFCNKVTLSLNTSGSAIEPISGGSFVPELGHLKLQGEGITGTFVGTVNDFAADIAATLYDSKVAVKGEVKNIIDFNSLTAEATVDIDTTPAKVGTIYHNILGEELPAEAKVWLERFATLAIAGTASLSPNQVVADVELGTNNGSLSVDGRLNYGAELIAFDGRISGDGLKAGEILQVEQLGKADLALEGAVELRDGALGGQLKADIARIGWANYDYNNIELQASLQGKEFKATAISTDPNITFSLEGDGTLDEVEPEYNLILSLDRADIGTLGLVKNDSSAWLAGSVEASLTGRSLDDMVGRAMVNNLIYATATDTLSTELMNISLRGGEQDKSFSLRSNIADVEYRSTASYEDVFTYLTKRVPSQFPWAKPFESDEEATAKEPREPLGDRLYMATDYTSVNLKIFDGENLASALLPDGNISSGSSLTLEFSPSAEEFALQVESNRIEAKELVIADLDIMMHGHGSTMDLRAESSEIRTAGLAIPEITIRATSNENHEVDANLYFSDTDAAVSGQVGAYAQLAYDDKGAFTASAKLHDSYIVSPNQHWTIEANHIDYSAEGIIIDNFVAQSADSAIGINGNINKLEGSPLSLSIRNIAVDEWVALLTGMDDVHGRLNGQVELYSALHQPYGNGSLNITSLSMGSIDVEPMLFSLSIPRGSTTANASVKNTISQNTLARGKYNYSDGTYEAKLTIDDFHFSLLEPMLKGIVHDLNGTGDINVELSGNSATALDIKGSVKATALATTVDFTGARYTIPSLKLTFEDKKGIAAPFRLEDSEGGWADVKATANLKNLEAITYEASVEPHNLIAINQTKEANAPFYGKVYVVDGGIKISGSNTSTTISGGVNTGNGSVFSIPLMGNSDFAGADFVTFVSHKQEGEAGSKGSQLKSKAKTPSNLSVDMMLGVDTNTLLRLIIDPETENVIEARGNASLGIVLDARKNDFTIRGDYQITEGVYDFNFQNIITKKFDINPGSYIRWNGSPLDANIDVAATYKLKTSLAPLLGTESTASRASTPVECIVKLTGSLAKVDVSFDINVPTANTEYQSILSSYFSSQEMMATQFVYLLALGNFYSDSSSGQNTTAGAAGTAIGLDFLASQVSRLVSNDTYKFNLKYKAIDDTSSSYSIDFQTELIDDRLTLELEANVDTGDYFETIGNNNQLSGGGSITLRLDPQGSLYLKGFSRTIDRFDENQGLQENGIGLYFQRSFNTFNELMGKKKSNATKAVNEKSGNFAPSDSPTADNKAEEDESDN